jgi:hypothetical protein
MARAEKQAVPCLDVSLPLYCPTGRIMMSLPPPGARCTLSSSALTGVAVQRAGKKAFTRHPITITAPPFNRLLPHLSWAAGAAGMGER